MCKIQERPELPPPPYDSPADSTGIWYSSPPSRTSYVSTWVTVSSTSHETTSDSDVNDVSMYYCALLLIP